MTAARAASEHLTSAGGTEPDRPYQRFVQRLFADVLDSKGSECEIPAEAWRLWS
jgi:hypothetical protein